MSEEDKDLRPEDRTQEADSDYGAKVARKPLDGEPIAKTSSGDADKMVKTNSQEAAPQRNWRCLQASIADSRSSSYRQYSVLTFSQSRSPGR